MQIAGYIKVGEKEHLDALRLKGQIYCNNVNYFKTLVDNSGNFRGDKLEGISGILHNQLIKLFDEKAVEMPVSFKPSTIYFYDELTLKEHLFCLYTIKSEYVNTGTFIDSRLIGLGQHALLITDTIAFKERLEKKLNELEFDYNLGFVDYYDASIDQNNLTVFHKSAEFNFQHEVRMHIKGQKEAFVSFEIGSLEDISMFIDSGHLDKLTMELADEKNEP